MVREIGTRPREEEQEGGRRKSGSGGEEGGCQKEGREAGPNFSAASWGRYPRSGLDLAVLFVTVVLSSSQSPRRRRLRVEARSGEQPGDPWLLSTSHPDHPPSHSPSWASDSLAVNHPRSLARPPGAPDSLLASCQQPSRSRVLFPPFEVYTYLISLGVIGITRQVVFPLSPSPSLWSAPVFPTGQRNGKRES